MKKSVRLIAVVMVALMLCLSLTSCFGKTLSGKYESDAGLLGKTTYEFSGKTVKISYTSILGTVHSVEGEYAIDDDEITFTFSDVEDDEKEDAKKLEGTFTFEEKEDSIVIGKVEYTKK